MYSGRSLVSIWMSPDTLFKSPVSFLSNDLQECQKVLDGAKVDIYPVFTEELSVSQSGNEFKLAMTGKELFFTQYTFFRFCGMLGIPAKFAAKIPNDLLLQSIDTMLSSGENAKLQMVVRNGNVLSNILRDRQVYTDAAPLFEIGDDFTKGYQLREGNITDQGSLFLFEPYADQTIEPVKGDPYNVGYALHFGIEPGLLLTSSYSFRHACGNISIAPIGNRRANVSERLISREKGKLDFYRRYFEKHEQHYFNHCRERHENSIQSLPSRNLVDVQYEAVYSALNKLAGKEVAWALLEIAAEDHRTISKGIGYKKARDRFRPEYAEEVDPKIELYGLFNRVTAAAKGYQGLDRYGMQCAGGLFI